DEPDDARRRRAGRQRRDAREHRSLENDTARLTAAARGDGLRAKEASVRCHRCIPLLQTDATRRARARESADSRRSRRKDRLHAPRQLGLNRTLDDTAVGAAMTFARAKEWQTKLGAFTARFRAETNLPGISIATTVDGERVCAAAGVGRNDEPLDAAARYELGCAVQLPLALLALELAREGKLVLDAPLGEYLAELRGSACGRHVLVE